MTLRRRAYSLASPFLACGLFAQPAPTSTAPAASSAAAETVVLSPFVITETDDQGYAATSTLAGTRLRTDLRDLGAAISVVTPEFLADIGAVDQQSLLSYTTGTETGGVQGNFAGVGDNAGQAAPRASRTDPQDNQRIRGLDRATVTRDYFVTDIGFDEYNTSRVTINRGPNSLLFGLGSPGGIINTSLKQPLYNDDFVELKLRVADHGTFRSTVDVNQVLVRNRVALRVAGLYNETYYKQKPAYNRDDRIYAALDAKLRRGNEGMLGATTLRANIELGRFGGTPPSVIPPGDGFSSWWEGLSRDVEQYTGTTLPARFVPGEDFVPQATVNNSLGPVVTNTIFRTPFFLGYNLIYADASGVPPFIGSDPAFAGLSGGQGRVLARPGRPNIDLRYSDSPYTSPFLPGFSAHVIQNREIFDYRNMLITGRYDEAWNDFDAHNIALEQTLFGGRGGVEFAYDAQSRKLEDSMGFGSGYLSGGQHLNVNVDISQFLTNDRPNPNVGRAVMKTEPTGLIERTYDREAFRATAFYELDFQREFSNRWLGRHVFTGLYNKQSLDTEFLQNVLVWDSDTVDVARVLNNSGVNGGQRNVVQSVYLTDSLLGVSSPDQVRLTDYMRIPKPQAGDRHTLFYIDPADRQFRNGDFYIRNIVRNGDLTRNEVESRAFSIQSYFFGGKLVGLAGWRTDDVTAYERVGSARLPDGEWDPANQRLQSDPAFESSGNTFTWSVVGHYPSEKLWRLPFGAGLSVFYNSSENFDSQSQRRNLFGKTLSPPTGVTKEYGFALESANRRVGARFNWFETSGTAKTLGTAGPPMGRIFFWSTAWLNRALAAEQELQVPVTDIPGMNPQYTTYEQFYNAIREIIPAEVTSQYNIRFENGQWVGDDIQGRADTTDTVAKGFEIEVVGSPVRNWNLSFNVAKQETINTNSAPTLIAVSEQIRANIDRLGLANTFDSFGLGESNTFFNRMRSDVFSPVAGIRARDGTVSQEQRKWRVNLVSTYRHDSGGLKGVGYGAAARWQDKVATGYPLELDEFGNQVPVLDAPYFGPDQWSGDLWVSYERELRLFRPLDWRIQLNVRNAFGTSGDIPTVTNPDGRVAVIRIENPTEWFITNTFRF